MPRATRQPQRSPRNGRRRLLAAATAVVALTTAAACGPELSLPSSSGAGGSVATPPPSGPRPATSWINRKPSLHIASPPMMAVGDTLTVLGNDFAPRGAGDVTLHFTGVFYQADGSSHPVDLYRNAKQVNGGKVQWDLWPDVVFVPRGDKLGRFVGAVRVTNNVRGQDPVTSDPLPVKIQIKPSLIARAVRPMDAGCSGIVPGTLEDVPMTFAVEAVGLRDASKSTPITFEWTFPARYFDVQLSNGTFDPSLAAGKDITLSQRVESGRASAIQPRAPRNLFVKIGEDLIGDARLKQLRTAKLPDTANADSQPVTAHVVATAADGKQVSLAMKLTVHKVIEVIYDGRVRIAQRFEPVQVTDCMPGGDIGREVGYSEGQHESRQRGLAVNWHADASLTLAPLGFFSESAFANFGAIIHASASFGVRVDESVSTERSRTLNLRGQLMPGQFGAFYRQTTKIHRVAQLVGHTVCGRSIDVGRAVLTDWTFTPDLAQGASCVPASNLPKAGVFADDE